VNVDTILDTMRMTGREMTHLTFQCFNEFTVDGPSSRPPCDRTRPVATFTWCAKKREASVSMHMHTRSLQSCLIKSRRACKTEATSHISLQRGSRKDAPEAHWPRRPARYLERARRRKHVRRSLRGIPLNLCEHEARNEHAASATRSTPQNGEQSWPTQWRGACHAQAQEYATYPPV
jgi:hypothetical protein